MSAHCVDCGMREGDCSCRDFLRNNDRRGNHAPGLQVLVSDLHRKFEHKINNVWMSINGTELKLENLDSAVTEIKHQLTEYTKSLTEILVNQREQQQSAQNFRGVLKWAAYIFGALFSSLLGFVLFKGL